MLLHILQVFIKTVWLKIKYLRNYVAGNHRIEKRKLNLTARSGRAAVKSHMDAMGYQQNDYDLDKLYAAFLKLADKKGQVFDYDLEALAFIDMQIVMKIG